jgi:hypothetical protein
MRVRRLVKSSRDLLINSSSAYICVLAFLSPDWTADDWHRSFGTVYKFLQKQVDRPFLKRYLKREEILRQIATCDTSLSDSVNTFSVRIRPVS